MRISLKKGKQSELINLVKKKFTWPELSKKLSISENYLRNELRKEQRLLSEKTYNELCALINKTFDKFIIKKLNDNWGKIKGGKISKGKTKEITIPKDSEELAEFYGAMLGDGNSYRKKYYESRNNKRGVYAIRIVGDSRLDKEYLLNYIKPIIENLFKVKVIVKFYTNKNAMHLESHGTKLIEFLEIKGFKPGNKIKNKLRIPNWIKSNKNYLKVCLRGLYDTDGSVYKLTNQNSHQICFTNANQNLLQDIRNSLLLLKINCSKISNKDIYITKKLEQRKFLKLIGFRNDRHLKKVKMWNLDSPVV